MRKIDEIGLKLCKMQADVFSASANETNCSSPIFMRRFMNSQVAQRMDLGGFLFEACDVNRIFEEIDAEFGESSYGKEKYSEAELYWIGYIYRYWSSIWLKETSNWQGDSISFWKRRREGRGGYAAYHKQDQSRLNHPWNCNHKGREKSHNFRW